MAPTPYISPKIAIIRLMAMAWFTRVYFNDGAVSYRNRYVQTAALTQELSLGKSISPGVMGPFDYDISRFGIKDTSNTDLCLVCR